MKKLALLLSALLLAASFAGCGETPPPAVPLLQAQPLLPRKAPLLTITH